MDYKGATGVRARSDLSPNPRQSATRRRLDFDELVHVAEGLLGVAKQAKDRGQHSVTLGLPGVLRVVDALLIAAGRPPEDVE